MQCKFKSPFGLIILIAYKGKLVYANWDNPECETKLSKIKELIDDDPSPENCNVIEETKKQLIQYFRRRRIKFELPIEFYGTLFQKQVWKHLLKIPYGETITYKNLAVRCNLPTAPRAVANACGANPLAIIAPCHRVVASHGGKGGYTGGLDKKWALLNLETQTPDL